MLIPTQMGLSRYTDQRHEETWHNSENDEAGGTKEHCEEEDADSRRPSKCAKVLVVIGKWNTVRPFLLILSNSDSLSGIS